MGSEPLGRLSHWVAYFFTHNGHTAVRAASCAAGVAVLFCAPTWAWLALTAPFCVVFFGYPSTCPWGYALLLLYLFAGIEYLETKPSRAPLREGLLLGLAVAAHGMICFATAAQIVLVFSWLYRHPDRVFGRLEVSLAAPFVFLLAIWAWSWAFGTGLSESPVLGNAAGGIFGGPFVKFSGPELMSGDFTKFVFGSWHYLSGLGAVVLLMYPAVILLCPTSWPKGEVGWFLGAAAVGCGALALFWNPDWGYLTDMRFATLASVPCEVALAWSISHSTQDRTTIGRTTKRTTKTVTAT